MPPKATLAPHTGVAVKVQDPHRHLVLPQRQELLREELLREELLREELLREKLLREELLRE